MKCTNGKRKQIAFLKTHKTGSSTMTGILNRFTDVNHLDIAIPVNDVRFNWPAPFTHEYVQLSRLKHQRVDVLDNHCVFNRPEITKVMKPNFRMITILREPVSQFYSMFYYLNLPKHYGLTNNSDPVAEFMKLPHKYHHFRPYLHVGREKYFEENLIHNGNLYDLDFARFKEKGSEKRGLKSFIAYLERAFHLVLITEKYDEGLILLKRLMCWDYMDIVHMKKHVNPELHNSSFVVQEAVAESIRAWNVQDKLLYDHFASRFDKIVALQEQTSFQKELRNLRELNVAVLDFCSSINSTTEEYSIERFDRVTKILENIGEKTPRGFLEQPACFCKKIRRDEKEYLYFFAKRFPPYYFMKGRERPQSTDEC